MFLPSKYIYIYIYIKHVPIQTDTHIPPTIKNLNFR